ncbi:replication factor-a protein [Lepidopterella palustris CBS 459.81]|uniref:Replication protein A subunit n=1 Tax=Lepidopterella palustris CBS 459.81 TaxID=1314670 RepID=A0A8E2JE08_9PEZI|nr:replication factor-a protein [Lepidopterella palustris CBS 459.81]
MAEAAINQGSLRAIFEQGADSVSNPVMQCVQLKAMDKQTGTTPRYRLVLSDIQNFIQTMLATQANHFVTEGKLKKGSIIRLKAFTPQTVKDKQILIILDIDVLEEYGELEKIGSPTQIEVKEEQKAQPAAISGNGFYGNKPAQPAPQQQNRSLPSHPHAPNNSKYPHMSVIDALSPYGHNWAIKARCTHKGEIKTWHNKHGEGKLFSVVLLDESGEIRATGFNDQCDALYDTFQEGGVYYISTPCKVVFAKKQFTGNIKCDYELQFESGTVVERAEDQTNVPQVRYNFTKIGDLDSVEKDTMIDTIGILKEVGEVSEIVSKTTSKPFSKRELTLADDSLTSVRLTIWGNSAIAFDAPLESVIAFKGVKVSDFGGRSLSLLSSGSMSIDPDIDDAHKLKGWYDAVGRQGQYTSHANATSGAGAGRKQDYKTIAQIREDELGISEEATYFNLKASVIYVKHDNFAYPACGSEGCNKKVIEDNPGEWRCEKCDKSFPRPHYRYIMSVNVSDYTGQIWLSCFDEAARTIMGMSADQLVEIKDNDEVNGTTMKVDAFQDATCKTYDFRVRAKMETFQDTPRVRYQVQTIHPLNFSRECARLTEILKQYDLNENSLFVQ